LQTYYLTQFTNQLKGYAVGVADQVAPDLATGANGTVVGIVENGIGAAGSQQSVIVVDARGRVVANSAGGPPNVGESLATGQAISTCLNGNQVVSRGVDAATNEPYIGAAIPVLSGGRLVGCAWARGTLYTIDQTLASIRAILLRTTAAALAVVALVTLLLARTITGPLAELTARAAEVAAGRFDRRIQVRGDDELSALASMFNHMSQRLRATLGEISAEKRKADAIFAHMADGIVAASPDGTVGLVNPAAARLLAIAPDAVGRPLREVVPAPVADAVLGKHSLQGFQVSRRQRLVHPEPVNGDVVLVVTEECTRLRLEALHVVWWRNAEKIERRRFANLVGKVRVQHVPAPLLDELNEVPQLLPDLLQHHHGDVLPPFLGLEFLQEDELLPDHRDVGLLFQHHCDGDDLVAKLCEARVVTEDGEL
jgi:HAMP domain-containing protein